MPYPLTEAQIEQHTITRGEWKKLTDSQRALILRYARTSDIVGKRVKTARKKLPAHAAQTLRLAIRTQMLQDRSGGWFARCTDAVARSNAKYHRTGNPGAVCGAAAKKKFGAATQREMSRAGGRASALARARRRQNRSS